MTRELRQWLRSQIDAHQRRVRQMLVEAGELTICCGCGCWVGDYVYGCVQCGDRRRRQERRGRIGHPA